MLISRNNTLFCCLGGVFGFALLAGGSTLQEPAPKNKKENPKGTVPKGFGNPEETRKDHQLMLKALGLSSIRQRAVGTTNNAANDPITDESRATRFPNHTDPLDLKAGTNVVLVYDWNPRRDEQHADC